MERNIQAHDRQRGDTNNMVPQVNATGNSRKGKGGTPKKGGGSKRSAPTTPSRRGRGGGRGRVRGATNATTPKRSTQTRSSTTPAGIHYNNIFAHKYVTDAPDIYKGPPGAAYITLRLEGSLRFKAFLRQLEASQQLESRPVGFTAGASITGPSIVPEVIREPFLVHTNLSSSDSGVDVLTPNIDNGPITGDNEQSIGSMAPVREVTQAERERLKERKQQVEVVSDSLKDVIHNFYEIQTQVQGYVSETETRDVLVNKIHELSQSLARLNRESSSNTITNIFVPPEVVDYVDDGRNPDIYTRELVEVVQRGNAVLNGKMNAFASFSEIFAEDLRKMSPEMAKAVDEIMNGGESEVDVKQENVGGRQS